MIFLRNVTIKDNETLSEMHKASFEDCWSVATFRNMLMDPSFFGFIVGRGKNGEATDCGFILCRRVLDEIDVITFCVLPEHRGLGLGKLLVIETIKQAEIILKEESDHLCAIKIFLEVAENNKAAINLYTAFGFDKVSKRPKYYKNKAGSSIDAHIMVLQVGDDREEAEN